MNRIFVLILFTNLSASAQDKNILLTAGIVYKGHPFDIEDVPRGGNYSGGGDFFGWEFWDVWGLHAQVALPLNNNWILSTEGNIRYNHFHWTEGYNSYTSGTVAYYNADRSFKRNFKYDAFILAERIVDLNKKRNGHYFVNAGVGLINMNTRYNVTLQDTVNGTPLGVEHYNGTLMRLSPKMSLGYQYKFLRFSVDGCITEDPSLMNLTSLWLGVTFGYQFNIRKNRGE